MMQMLNSWGDKIDRWAPVVARVLISIVFIYAAWSKIRNWEVLVQSFDQLPLLPGLLWAILAIGFELIGAVFLLIGFKTRIAAFMLVVFVIMTIIIGHINWTVSPIQFQLVDILKNLAIIGGLLLAAKHGRDYCSVDNRMSAMRTPTSL